VLPALLVAPLLQAAVQVQHPEAGESTDHRHVRVHDPGGLKPEDQAWQSGEAAEAGHKAVHIGTDLQLLQLLLLGEQPKLEGQLLVLSLQGNGASYICSF
jgi:hypothetical protein